MNILRLKPNKSLYAHRLPSIAIRPDLGTKYHADGSIALFLDGRKVPAILLVARIPAADFDLEEVHWRGLASRPVRIEAAKRSARKLFDVVNPLLRELYDPIHDQLAEIIIIGTTKCLLKAAFMFAASEGATSALITVLRKRGAARPRTRGVGHQRPGRDRRGGRPRN